MAAVSSVVATGRRMKIREGFIVHCEHTARRGPRAKTLRPSSSGKRGVDTVKLEHRDLGATSMKLHFHGAAGDVTGAAFQLTTRQASVLVDCGLYQGNRQTVAKNRNVPRLARRHVDAVVVSHAHLDHIGRLPLLTKRGYTGPLFGTEPTFDLGRVIMRDALRLQLGDLERENRRRTRDR